MNSSTEVEHDEVVAELLARGPRVKSSARSFSPVERDALRLHEGERLLDRARRDALTAIEDPRLVDLVLGEAGRSRAEVAVDHPHRGVAEHQHEDAPARISAATARAISPRRAGIGREWSAVVPRVRDAAALEHHVSRPLHEASSAVQSACVGPETRERAIQHLEARAGVEQPDEPRPAAREVRREEERVVLAGHARRSCAVRRTSARRRRPSGR